MDQQTLYAPRQVVRNISDCFFYHVMDLPGYGIVGDQWDLRGHEDEYLGHVPLAAKRVLELGTASGFLYRHMLARGADVVGFDLSPEGSWDLVPFAKLDIPKLNAHFKDVIAQLNRGWWFSNQLFGINGKVVYGDIYNIPPAIGAVDVSLFGMILLHLRDPFHAMFNALRLTRRTAIVTEIHPEQPDGSGIGSCVMDSDAYRNNGSITPLIHFMPDNRQVHPGSVVTWWCLTPQVVQRFLGVLGFEDQTVTEHFQLFQGKKSRVFTVVAHRTAKSPLDLID